MLETFLLPIGKECDDHLNEIPTKQSQAAAKIVVSLGQASPEAFEFLVCLLLEKLLSKYTKVDSIAERHAVLETMLAFLRAATDAYGDWNRSGMGDRYPGKDLDYELKGPYSIALKEQVLSSLLQTFLPDSGADVKSRVLSYGGLLEMCKIHKLLTDQEITRIIRISCNTTLMTVSEENEDLESAAVDGLRSISNQKSQLVLDEAVPFFVARLSLDDAGSSDSHEQVLKVLAKLGSSPSVAKTVIIRLKNHLVQAIQMPASQVYTDTVAAALLSTVWEYEANAADRVNRLKYDDIIRPILSVFFEKTKDQTSLADKEVLLDRIGQMSMIFIRQESLEKQKELACEVYSHHRELQRDDSSPFTVSLEKLRIETMILSTYMLASFRKEVPLPYNVKDLLAALVSLSLDENVSNTIKAVIYLQIFTFITKFLTNKEVDGIVRFLVNEYNLLERNGVLSTKVTFAILKGVLQRNRPFSNTMLQTLLQRLSDPTPGHLVAQCFATLLRQPSIISVENSFRHATNNGAGGLFMQKTFNMLLSATEKALRSTPSLPLAAPEEADGKPTAPPAHAIAAEKARIQRTHLIAFAGVVRCVDYHHVIQPELPRVFPLLLQSLDLGADDFVRITATETLMSAVEHDKGVVEEHVSGLLGRLVGITTGSAASSTATQSPLSSSSPLNAKKANESTRPSSSKAKPSSPLLRILALQALALMPQHLRPDIILPFRRSVVKELVAALDDGKRAVRAQAVRCRVAWVGVDEEEE